MKKIKMSLAGTKVVEKWKIWITIPIVIVMLALVAFGIYAGVKGDVAQGINVGIDFTGGNIVTIHFKDNLDKDTYNANLAIVNEVLSAHGTESSLDQQAGETGIVIRYPLISKDNTENEVSNAAVKADIEKIFEGKLLLNAEGVPTVDLEYNGPSASATLILTAFLSVLISTILILFYIIIRFKNLFTGLSAVIALIHDVIMVFCMTLIFNIQINSAFIAAIITVIAYSINNTIVLFDRVRENELDHPIGVPMNRNYVVNKSIAQTLSRSMITTITTMAAIVIFAIIGVDAIREFALPVIFGLVAGTFSSVFLAPSLYCQMKAASDRAEIKRKAKPKKEKKSGHRKAKEAI